MQQLKELRALEKELAVVLEDRRDTIPYLIESYRGVVKEDPKNLKLIVARRADSRNSKEFKVMWEMEQALEEELEKLFKATGTHQGLQKDMGWLEAHTEIQKYSKIVADHEGRYNDLLAFLEGKTKKFPYLIFKTYVEKRI